MPIVMLLNELLLFKSGEVMSCDIADRHSVNSVVVFYREKGALISRYTGST